MSLATRPTDAGEWITTAAASHRLGLTPQRVRDYLAEGRLEHRWTPLGRLISAADVERMVVQRTERSAR